MRRTSLISSVLAAAGLTGCVNGPIDPVELIANDVVIDAEQPEMSRLPDGSLAQRYIVVLRNDLLLEGYVPGIVSELVVDNDIRLERVYQHALGGFAATLTSNQLATLRARPDVAFVVPDVPAHVINNDGDNGGGNDPDVQGPPRASAPAASDWGLVDVLGSDWATRANGAGLGGDNIKVAVLDTGIAAHASLPTSVCLGDFTNTVGSCTDGHRHGTHVAGTIAAIASGTSAAGTLHRGIAPNVDLLIGKVLQDGGSGSQSGILNGIEAAVVAQAKVINMSLGGATYGSAEESDPYCTAITNAAAGGTLTTVAAGNDGRDASQFSPARCDDALTVGAYDSAGKLASFTNYGADVDINAPGVSIYSTALNGGFARLNGTSMASPHAAAVAALFIAANPATPVADVISGVVQNSTDRGAPLKYSNKITSTKPKLDGRDY